MKKIITALVMAMASAVWAANFTYQGVLLNEDGTPLKGSMQIEFRIYDAASGTPLSTALWGRLYNVQLKDGSGLFNVELSDITGSALTDDKPSQTLTLEQVFQNSDSKTFYIGIRVKDSSGEIVPRQKLSPVPTAMFAHDVKTAKGSFTVKENLVSQTIKATDITADSKITASEIVATKSISGNGTIPVGGIIMWSGSKVPQGWALCNGENGTPNLSGRFIVATGNNGESNYSIGNQDGQDRMTLSIDHMPAHSHSTTFQTVGYTASWNDSKEAMSGEGKDKNNGNRTKSTNSQGGGRAFDNRPKFYALAFIMRIQ